MKRNSQRGSALIWKRVEQATGLCRPANRPFRPESGHPAQRGVALVITLILLSVITFMAVTFLVVSRHEGAQVDTLTQQSNAKFAAEAAAEQAKAQVMAQMMANQNAYTIGMMVSTNWDNRYFDPTANPPTSLTNVGYAHIDGTPLLTSELPQMLNNLLILPRVPVFIQTNNDKTQPRDFRYYLDLNRNGFFDTNGAVVEFDPNSLPPLAKVTNYYQGDPEWIGILSHPESRHSASNFFIGRYCFVVLPIGNSLDVNYIHNAAKRLNPAGTDGFFRNEGANSWEINLAGFLNSLNTNATAWGWGNGGGFQNYNYQPVNPGTSIMSGSSSTGNSFLDAASLLQYRYNVSYANLPSFAQMYSGTQNAISRNNIDEYSIGPLMTDMTLPVPANFGSLMSGIAWSGADNTNQYYTIQDLFNHGGTSFSNHMVIAGTTHSPATNLTSDSYNRYTFYRMLSQLSFGSKSEAEAGAAEYPYNVNSNPNYASVYGTTTPKMNLNYNNWGMNGDGTTWPKQANFVPLAATNFVPWTPIGFFTLAADRMLRAYFPNAFPIANGVNTNFVYLSITNIPIYIGNSAVNPNSYSNLYTPAVQRILQLAANMYDASTNRTYPDGLSPNGPFMPSVFHPFFTQYTLPNALTVVAIAGYKEDTNSTAPPAGRNFYNNATYSLPEDLNPIIANINSFTLGNDTINIYGIPWIIGARKGFPNFNKFTVQTVAYITRKVQLVKLHDNDARALWQTNIQYQISITNQIGLSVWNSYSTPISRPVWIYGADSLFTTLAASNDLTGVTTYLTNNALTPAPLAINQTLVTPAQWGAFNGSTTGNASSFQVPLSNTIPFVPNLTYHQNPTPYLTTATNFLLDAGSGYIQPHFLLYVTNRLRFIMTDQKGRVIDYVCLNLNNTNYNYDLTALLSYPGPGDGGIWDITRTNGNAIKGVINQIDVAAQTTITGYPTFIYANQKDWDADQIQAQSMSNAITKFQQFYNNTIGPATNVQVPFTPTREIELTYTWEANDPLVHYTLSDLTQIPASLGTTTNTTPTIALSAPVTLPALASLNKRYEPWGNGANGSQGGNDTANASNMNLKDSLISSSDFWQFPTNLYPNVGWLGRVHRGTPWQTVYLKSGPGIDTTNWQNWTGDTVNNSGYNDWALSLPTNDWLLMDLFTTSVNDNANRGQLSINQTNLAAWAAVLDGVVALSNSASGLVVTNIDPNSASPTPGLNMVQYLVNSINAARPATGFTNLGQILSVPQLTTSSPFLSTANGGLRDEVYERIPQQIMSLLRLGTPRYVIFAYGQSLKPADNSIVQSGPFFGMCTNYQITGEMATRTVLRVDNFPVPGSGTPPRAVVESYAVLPPE